MQRRPPRRGVHAVRQSATHKEAGSVRASGLGGQAERYSVRVVARSSEVDEEWEERPFHRARLRRRPAPGRRGLVGHLIRPCALDNDPRRGRRRSRGGRGEANYLGQEALDVVETLPDRRRLAERGGDLALRQGQLASERCPDQ